MADMMAFPNTVEEFMEQYKITDTEHVYTNGVDLVPIFRMKQWFEHKPEQRWIPVSERLPEHNQICIVTDDTRTGTYEYGFHKETYDEENGWTYLGHKIIAWMPLPEPWKGDTE